MLIPCFSRYVLVHSWGRGNPLVRRGKPPPLPLLPCVWERRSSTTGSGVKAESIFPLQSCESRLPPWHTLHVWEFSRAIMIACWCFQGTVFKITCKYLHAVDFKFKPLESDPNVKFHLCRCNQHILIFFPNDLAFREGSKLQRPEAYSLRHSQYSPGIQGTYRGKFLNVLIRCPQRGEANFL